MSTIAGMGATLIALIVLAFVAVIGVVGMFAAIRKFYIVPAADEALVKTGGKHAVVSTGSGLWVIPMFHKVARVSLRSIRVPIERTGQDSVPSLDMIPTEVRGEMFVQVNPQDEKAILLAVQALGASSSGEMGQVVMDTVDSQVTDALRTAAFRKTFLDINSKKSEFADDVQQMLGPDIAKLGLTLTAVAITHVTQGPFTKDEGDVIAAQGRRNVAETVQKNLQETNLITRQAQVKIATQDVDAQQSQLAQDLRQKKLVAEQAREVAEYEAEQAAETKKSILTQEQSKAVAEAEQVKAIALAQIKQDQEKEAAQIAKDQTIATQRAKAAAEQKKAEEESARVKQEAEIARAKAVEAAGIEKEKTIKVAAEQREQAIAEAEIAKQVAIATKKAEEAAARAAQATAEAEKQRAEQTIITVEAEAKADRERKVVVIKAEEEQSKQRIAAERDAYVQSKAADRDAYVQAKTAEGEKDATVKRAEAAKAEAVGKSEAMQAEATGRASAMQAEATGKAEAIKIAANAQAAAVTTAASAEATARVTRAEAEFKAADNEAQAKIKLAEALLEEGKAKAASEQLMVEARNKVSPQLVMRDIAVQAISTSPAFMKELMAPVANVAHDVKILQVNGLGNDDGKGVQGLPATILNTGLAAAGIKPFLTEALRAVKDDPDVNETMKLLGDVATGALRAGAGAVKEGLTGPDNGKSA